MHKFPPKYAPKYEPLTYEGRLTPMTPNEVQIIIDTGASISITNSKNNFVSEIHPVQPLTLKEMHQDFKLKEVEVSNMVFTQILGKFRK